MQILLDDQKRAITKLQHYKVGALFMEPGTGKTRAAYELVRSVPGVDYVLYLAPYQAIYTPNYAESVPAEVKRCGGFSMTHDFIGFESLSSSDRIYLQLLRKIERAAKPFIIADESLKIKNIDAKRTQRIIELGSKVEYKLILNGTPVSRNLLDLWPQMQFLSPKILNMCFSEYKNTFVEYTVMTKRIGHRKLIREWINRYHNIDYLYSLIGPFVFDAQLNIGAKIQYIDIPYNLTSEEKEQHQFIKEKYLDNERMQLRNNNIFLEITQKLQHNYSLSPEKFEAVNYILKKNNPAKVLLCAKYIDTQEALRKRYPNIRVLSWQKNSFSLNLQAYNAIIKFDKHWDYALHEQLKHRVYRTGQQDDCLIYNLTGDVGLEKMMNDNAGKKGTLLDAFMKKSITELQKEL
jgi:uncharacterized protein YnzC (UPF0291/DUF896 family)